MKFRLSVTRARLRSVFVAGSALVIVAGLSGGSDAVASTIAEKTSDEMCASMRGLHVPALEIGLPTSGATIASAILIAATAEGNTSGEYCKVLGKIHPIDFSAPDIRFEVDLPSTWNGKSVHFGGGGLDGQIPATAGFASSGLTYTEVKGTKTPLARGYVTLGSDGGHQGNFAEGTFLQNDEAMANYAGEHVKKTHDVALFLTKYRYGASSSHSYYIGGSGGGRQGLVAAQRYPADYDGVIATYPALELLGLSFQMGRVSQASLASGGFINAAKASVLKAAVMAQCDSLDGATDGVISNPALCHFDPATIRCPGGVDSGSTCLSDAQLKTVNTLATPLVTSFEFASGIRTVPGYNILSGTDFWNPYVTPLGKSPENAIVDPAIAPPGQGSFFYSFPNNLVRFAIARNPSVDLMTFNFSDPGSLTARTKTLSNLIDPTSTDMTAFKNRGGKMILQHGQSDQFIPAQMSIDYYNRLLASYGQGALKSFLKFYLVPGAAHVFGGQFEGAYDGLTVLDNWVVKGVNPSNLVITDMKSATAGRTRPLCEYPRWPKYIAGDVNVASSFSCSN